MSPGPSICSQLQLQGTIGVKVLVVLDVAPAIIAGDTWTVHLQAGNTIPGLLCACLAWLMMSQSSPHQELTNHRHSRHARVPGCWLSSQRADQSSARVHLACIHTGTVMNTAPTRQGAARILPSTTQSHPSKTLSAFTPAPCTTTQWLYQSSSDRIQQALW